LGAFGAGKTQFLFWVAESVILAEMLAAREREIGS
jgi:hypothetical protein